MVTLISQAYYSGRLVCAAQLFIVLPRVMDAVCRDLVRVLFIYIVMVGITRGKDHLYDCRGPGEDCAHP